MTYVSITRGSVETILVDVEDVLGNLTDLDVAGAQFDVKDTAGVYKMQNVDITIDGARPLRAKCLVDTTIGGIWTAGKYFLYVHFTNNLDTPILGPLEFSVNP